MANEIEVRLVLDDGTYKKAIIQSEKQAKTSGKKIGNTLEDSIEKKLKGSLLSLKTTILGVGSAFAAAFAGKAILSAAIRQENAVQALNQALRSAGTFSKEASDGIQAFAAQIEATTITSDEAALELYSLARALSTSNDQAQKMTQAALELSAATGMSAESAVKNLGKSLSGLTGELGESLPAIKTLTAEQLKSGAALQFVLDRFGGSAAAQVKTFGGSITQLSNSFGTLLEGIGGLVTNSKGVRAILTFLAEKFLKIATNVEKIGSAGSTVDKLLLSLIDFSRGVTKFVIAPIELVFNIAEAAFRMVENSILQIGSKITDTVLNLFTAFSPNSETTKNIRLFADNLRGTMSESLLAMRESIASQTSDFGFTDGLDTFLEQMQMRATAAINTTEQMKDDVGNNFQGMADKISKAADQIRSSMRATIVGGISRGIQNITNALLKGENVFEAFAGSVLSTFGDLAIQLGEFYIAQGIANLALKSVDPTGTIAAGAGLIALGTILKSFFAAGGSGGAEPASTASGGPVAGGGLSSPASDVFTNPDEVQKKGPDIAVNIQGNVLDRRETGLEIVSIINEAFEQQGAVVRTA